jgi:hypothetical protein
LVEVKKLARDEFTLEIEEIAATPKQATDPKNNNVWVLPAVDQQAERA